MITTPAAGSAHPPPPENGIQGKANQHGAREHAVDDGDSPFGDQHRIAELTTGGDLPRGKSEHHQNRHRSPDDPECAVQWVVLRDQCDARLTDEVGGQSEKCNADEPQRPPSPSLARAGEFPQHHRARTDFNE